MKLFKYLLLALTAIGSIQAMELPLAHPLQIIDGKGTQCTVDPIVLEHSITFKAMNNACEAGEVDLSQKKQEWLTESLLNLAARALNARYDKTFWKKLTDQELSSLHRLHDYLNIPLLWELIIQELEDRESTLLSESSDADPLLFDHYHQLRSIQTLLDQPESYSYTEETLRLSNKNLRNIYGLSNLPEKQRKECTTLDLSYNNIEVLDLDAIFKALPSLCLVNAEHSNIKRVYGKKPLPKRSCGIHLRLAHNEISNFDESILRFSQNGIFDLADNRLTPEKVAQLEVAAAQRKLSERIRKEACTLWFDKVLPIPTGITHYRGRPRMFYSHINGKTMISTLGATTLFFGLIFVLMKDIAIYNALLPYTPSESIKLMNEIVRIAKHPSLLPSFLKEVIVENTKFYIAMVSFTGTSLALTAIANTAYNKYLVPTLDKALEFNLIKTQLSAPEQRPFGPFAEIHSEHIACAAQKMAAAKAQIAQTKHTVTRKRNTDNSGFELLLKK